MLWIIGVLLALSAGCVVVAVFLFREDAPGIGILAFILGFGFLLASYWAVYDAGFGNPARPNDLNKKIIYIFEGKVEVGQNESIAILKDARGAITCIKTSADLPPETEYVKKIELLDGDVELTPVRKKGTVQKESEKESEKESKE